MFVRWFSAVKTAFDRDRAGWGPANRYEARHGGESHEGLIPSELDEAGFRRESPAYPKLPGCHADGVVSHPEHQDLVLRYELKSAFLRHYHSAEHNHNQDFERLLRLEHRNGALGDIDRLRGAVDPLRVFLLVGVSWCAEDEPAKLALYERHRAILLDTFATLGGLPAPSDSCVVVGDEKLWSTVIRAWLVEQD